MKFTDLQSCPFCGCDTYYEKQKAFGNIEYNSMFNGKDAPNYEMYDGLIREDVIAATAINISVII